MNFSLVKESAEFERQLMDLSIVRNNTGKRW